MTDKPEALRLADWLDALDVLPLDRIQNCVSAADELRRLNEIEVANQVWSEKTQWLEATAQPHELGMHRADVMKQRIDSLEAQRDELLEALKGIIQAEHSEGRGGSGFIPKAPTLEHQQRVYQAWQKAHAAIAKVEGEKQ